MGSFLLAFFLHKSFSCCSISCWFSLTLLKKHKKKENSPKSRADRLTLTRFGRKRSMVGVFSEWLFSTFKILYVNTTQNRFLVIGKLHTWRRWLIVIHHHHHIIELQFHFYIFRFGSIVKLSGSIYRIGKRERNFRQNWGKFSYRENWKIERKVEQQKDVSPKHSIHLRRFRMNHAHKMLPVKDFSFVSLSFVDFFSLIFFYSRIMLVTHTI